MDHARPDGSGPGEPSPAETSPDEQVTEPLHALFQRRVAGDDALLELARLRFTQTGLAAELYADTPGELEHVLQFVPPHRHLPTVHLNRGLNLLHEPGRATVGEFAGRFAGRVGGLVVHDQRAMGDQTDRLLRACASGRTPPTSSSSTPRTWSRPGSSSWPKSSRTRSGSASASTSATSATGRRPPGSPAATPA